MEGKCKQVWWDISDLYASPEPSPAKRGAGTQRWNHETPRIGGRQTITTVTAAGVPIRPITICAMGTWQGWWVVTLDGPPGGAPTSFSARIPLSSIRWQAAASERCAAVVGIAPRQPLEHHGEHQEISFRISVISPRKTSLCQPCDRWQGNSKGRCVISFLDETVIGLSPCVVRGVNQPVTRSEALV